MVKIFLAILTLCIVGFATLFIISNFEIGGLGGPRDSGRIKNAPPKGYSYSSPSNEAKARNIECTNFYHPKKIPIPLHPLCLNLYQTSASDLEKRLNESDYDRIILYGENFILDTPTKITTYKLYNGLAKSVYDTAIFTDRITIPVLLKIYGLKDLSTIGGADTKYPAIYTRISTNEELRIACSEFALGCSLDVSYIALPQTALNVWYSSAESTIKKPTGQELKYSTDWPEDCYSTTVIIHEFSHAMQVMRVPGDIKKTIYFLPAWFREHVSGFIQREGANVICGSGTMQYLGKENIVQFESEFPPAELEHDHPKNECSQAVMVVWNRYLSDGDVWQQHAKFFTAVRQQAPTVRIYDEGSMVKVLLQLRGTKASSDRNFLKSHGCSY